ncbi:MAG: thioredoxin domain-containing protein [Candidatus Omnitrophica bacterium]|nr:thioredoxin domain-containing protein [Candidatus Omnitrophota bacterium]
MTPPISLENRLGSETSAYLKSAAGQPVHWQPWGEAALAKARELNRPILLDIGAVWCHWCHVMDRESYENAEIAKIINENFVPVKVDRDERPDVDLRYQKAVSAFTGQGGWPLTAFLTPEGKVFYGGTYFPPDERWGRPGYGMVLKRISEAYRERPNEVMRDADKVFEFLAKVPKTGSEPLDKKVMDSVLQSAKANFDPVHGGFGSAPKFPHAEAVELLFLAAGTGEDWALPMALKTLEEMGKGGVYDQLGGGFHRYSTDERWIVPHFEKMLYDNAPLLVNYCRAWQATGDNFYWGIAEGIMRYVNTWGADREKGGFYASQDADISLHDDGDYYTWTRKEVEALLESDEARVLIPYYDIYEYGEMQHEPSRNVLYIARPLETIAKTEGIAPEETQELLNRGRGKLIDARAKRQAPFVDQTLYTNWNGMMITAYLEAYRTRPDESARDLALKTLNRILTSAYQEGEGLAHEFGSGHSDVRGIFDDQIQVASALVLAFEVTGDWNYLGTAESLMQLCLDHYWDKSSGGFLDRDPRLKGAGRLLESPQRVITDSPTPSGNGVAAQVLLKLYYITGKEDYRNWAQKTLEAFTNEVSGAGIFAASYAIALHHFYQPPLHAVIVGQKDSPLTGKLIQSFHAVYRPGKILTLIDPQDAGKHPLPEVVRAQIQATVPEVPTAFVCAGTSCAPPTQDPLKLEELVASFK